MTPDDIAQPASPVRALVYRERGGIPRVETVLLPGPATGEVRIRMHAAGVCHSDLSFVGGMVPVEFPLIPGHEASGTVIALGEGVDDLAVGDPVVLDMSRACRSCWPCAHGEPWLCEETKNSAPAGQLEDGTTAYALMELGLFAEETVVPRNYVIPLAREVPLDLAALLSCGVTTGVGAIRNNAKVRPGESVAVFGLGGVGLAAVAGARMAGADPIIAIDISPAKEELARRLGATHFLISDEKVARHVRSLTEGRGADHAVECVGRAATIRLAWASARRGGQCTVVGFGRRDDMVSFSALELYHFARTITAAPMGSTDFGREIPVLAEAVRTGEFDLGALVTHRISLEEVPEAFERMHRGEGGRSLVVFGA